MGVFKYDVFKLDSLLEEFKCDVLKLEYIPGSVLL